MDKTATTNNMAPSQSNSTLHIVRYLVGALFIFSGLIKANDPLGLSFKMADFFREWGMEGFIGTTYVLAILIITFEIIAGVALIIGYKFKSFSFLLLLLMIFFTFLTAYAVGFEMINGRELKCGCFGDCIPLTATQSFIKDIILLILVIYLFVKRRQIVSMLSPKGGMIAMIVALVLTLLIQWGALRYLPYIDCLPFKEGNNVGKLYKESMTMKDSFTVTYTFDDAGKKVVLGQEAYLEDANQKYWEMEPTNVDNKLVSQMPSYAPIMKEFSIVDQSGVAYQPDIFASPDAFFIFSIRDLETMDKTNIDKIKKIHDDLNIDNKAGMIVVSSSTVANTQKFMADNGMPNVQIFTLDDISNKILIRSNPGLVLIQDGIIKNKWAPAAYPSGFIFEGNTLKAK